MEKGVYKGTIEEIIKTLEEDWKKPTNCPVTDINFDLYYLKEISDTLKSIDKNLAKFVRFIDIIKTLKLPKAKY